MSLFNGEVFDTSYKVAGDSKFLLSALKIFNSQHVDITLAKMPSDGISNNLSNLINTENEIKRVCKELNLSIPFIHRIQAVFKRRLIIIISYVFPSIIIYRFKNIYDRFWRQ